MYDLHVTSGMEFNKDNYIYLEFPQFRYAQIFLFIKVDITLIVNDRNDSRTHA